MHVATPPVVIIGLTVVAQPACAQGKPAERQIAEAVAPLPASMRDGATVIGYRGARRMTLREGTGEMVCLADDPTVEEFHVACYHRSLEPFMARGRELREAGRDDAEVRRIRTEEANAGALPLPERPAALYSLTGGTFTEETGEVDGARRLYVLYVPYATEASTGISAEPSRDRPWLMLPGEPWAHVMIAR
jgi:hypothetical protein